MGSAERRFDYLIIGSGFGGSVAALRLVQKGYSVALLEAGKRWDEQSFPRSNWDASRFLWAPKLGLHGLMRIEVMRHMMALRGTGYGGGSLIYGNTLIRPLASFFQSATMARLGGAEALGPYYALAEKMMGVVPNPRLFAPDHLLRELMQEYGEEARQSFAPSPVGAYFGEPGVEVDDPYFLGEGPARTGCTYCGGCFIGCRVGAKNTLPKGYLHLAEALGLVVFTETEAQRIQPLSPDGSAGYRVAAKTLGGEEKTFEAGSLFVCAGVMGTHALLLRAREEGDLPRLSARLGRRVRTNSESVVAVRTKALGDLSKGIAASSSAFPDPHTQVQIDRYPRGSDALALLSGPMIGAEGKGPRWWRALKAMVGDPVGWGRAVWPPGLAEQTMFLVVMEDRDSSVSLRMSRGMLGSRVGSFVSDEDTPPSSPPLAEDVANKLAARCGGAALSTLSETFAGLPVTAHILGGCAIGQSPEEGVIDRQHRAFGYPNLRIADGSVIPENLGVNPALSILALSERALSFVPPKGGDPSVTRWLKVDRAWGVQGLLARAR